MAALTLPTLVTKYQKKLVAKRLAHFSSVMQQGFQLRNAQVIDGTFVEMEGSELRAKNSDDMLNFVERYWKPYVKFSKIEKLQKGVVVALPNGSGAYFIKTYNSTDLGSSFYIITCPEYKYCKDINENFSSINKLADRKTRFLFFGDGSPYCLQKKYDSRVSLLNRCINDTWDCAALIERDGWEIKDDYPW